MANRISIDEVQRQIEAGSFEGYDRLANVRVSFIDDSKLSTVITIANTIDTTKKDPLKFYSFSVDGSEHDGEVEIFKYSFVQAIASFYAKQHRDFIEHDLNQKMKPYRTQFLSDLSTVIQDVKEGDEYRVLLKATVQSFLED